MAPQTSTKLTYEDYVLIPDDGKRHEIIDGEHYVSPAPKLSHQRILLRIAMRLGTYIAERRLGELFVAPADVILSDINVFQPDLVFVSAARLHILTDANVQGAPDLAVEILSSGTRTVDERLKYKQYDRFGVAEYWIVDGDAEQVKIHRRVGDALLLVDTVSRDGAVTSPLFPGLALEANEIFAN